MNLKLQIGLVVCAGVISSVSFWAYWIIPGFLEQIVFNFSAISRGSLAGDLYTNIPFAVRQDVFVFNITNSQEYLAGAKPKFEQLGPYSFNLSLTKDMTWSGDDLITYREKRIFKFMPEISARHLTDVVYTVDPVFAIVQEVIDDLPQIIQDILRPLLKTRTGLFLRTVDEILYSGYRDKLAELAHLFKPDLPVIDGKIGYLRALNNTDDGQFTIHSRDTYLLNQTKRNTVVEWNQKSYIPYYGSACNAVYGTNGELFPAFDFAQPPSEISIFQALLCRPWPLHFNGTVRQKGLALARYKSAGDMFSPTGDPNFDSCQQPKGWAKGLFDVSNCQHGFPALVSLPHFLGAEQCLKDVEGLHPNASEHNMEMLLFPLLGVPVRPAIRIQANVRVRRSLGSTTEPIVYPVLWQQLYLSEDDVSFLSSVIFYAIRIPALVLSGLAMLIAVVALGFTIFLLCSCRRSKVIKEDEQPILTPADELPANDEASQLIV